MARGGVETSLATGRPEIDIEAAIGPRAIATEVTEGIGPNMGVPPIMSNDGMGDFSTNTTGAPPAIPAPDDPTGDQTRAQARPQGMAPMGRPTLTPPQLNQDYRYTQRDFYGNNPTITATDPVGRQMYVPSYGEVPYAILGSQMQELQKQKAANKAKQEALFAPKLNDTAPQYQQEFATQANNTIQDFIQGQIDSFGGDRSRALDYLTNDPKGKLEYAALTRNLNALSSEVKYVADAALEKQTAVSKGLEKYSTPEEKEYVERIIRGYSNIGTDKQGDLQQLVNDSRALTRVMSREKYFTENVVPAMNIISQDTESVGKPYWSGGRWILPVTDRKNYDQAIDGFAREMTIGGQFDHVDEAKEWLGRFMQPEVKVQAIVRDPITSSSSGESKPTAASLATVDYSQMPANLFRGTITDPKTGKTTEGDLKPTPGATMEYPTLNLVDVVSGRGQTPFAREFRGRDGVVFMHPTRIMDINGTLFIVGKKTGQQRTAAKKAGGDDYSPGGEEEMSPQEFNTLPDAIVPYEENKGLIESSFQGLSEKTIKERLGSTPGKVSARQPGGARAQEEATKAPKTGVIENGYKFMGGDPADPKNWVKQ